MDELKKYFEVARRLREGKDVDKNDIQFFLEFSPQINSAKMQKLIDGGEFASFEDAQSAITEAGRALQTSPEYKQKTLEIARQSESSRISDNLAQGFNLILAGTDIANSINQIRQSNSASKKSRRPSKPLIPQRDIYLQNALRSAEVGTMDSARALAPIEGQINDTYQSDIANARTASAGQAGAFGAYSQLAYDRKNKSSMQLAPIADQIRAREQARYDGLLGMRLGETQNLFENQASLYPYDLQQYNYDQQAIASLGSQGRENLRGSLYNFAGQAANTIGQQYSKRKYDQLRNQALASGLNPDYVSKANQNLDQYVGKSDVDYSNPNYWQQLYY